MHVPQNLFVRILRTLLNPSSFLPFVCFCSLALSLSPSPPLHLSLVSVLFIVPLVTLLNETLDFSIIPCVHTNVCFWMPHGQNNAWRSLLFILSLLPSHFNFLSPEVYIQISLAGYAVLSLSFIYETFFRYITLYKHLRLSPCFWVLPV